MILSRFNKSMSFQRFLKIPDLVRLHSFWGMFSIYNGLCCFFVEAVAIENTIKAFSFTSSLLTNAVFRNVSAFTGFCCGSASMICHKKLNIKHNKICKVLN